MSGFELTLEERRLVDGIGEFAARDVAPQARDWERNRTFPLDTIRQAADLGALGMLVPLALGGLGLRPTAMAAAAETLAAADFFFAFALVVHNNLAGAIGREGNHQQRGRYLPALLRGARIGAFLLTEPHAGSDAAAIGTRAERDGPGWRLTGEKAWISNGTDADVLSVYAQTDPQLGWRGIAAFLVDADRPGVERLPAYSLLGGHTLGTAGFAFDACQLPADALFLPPGRGFKAAMEGIDLARVAVAAMCCGMLDRALDLAAAHAGDRQAFGGPLADKQGLVWMLADAATDLAAARALTREAAARLDVGDEATLAAAHAKKFAARAAFARIADCMQVHGATGLSDELPLGRFLAAAKTAEYLDGTNEIQNLVIARNLLSR